MKEFARSSVQENERQMFAPRSQAQCKPWSGFGVKPDLGPLRRRRGESLLRSLEAGLTIDVKVLPGRGEFKGLNEFILRTHGVLLAGLPSGRKVLKSFTLEQKTCACFHGRWHRVLVHKSFLVELPHH